MLTFHVNIQNSLSGRYEITLITIVFFTLVFMYFVLPESARIRGGEFTDITSIRHSFMFRQNMLLQVIFLS